MKIRTKLLVTLIPVVSMSIAVTTLLAIDNFARTIQSEIVAELEIVTENLMDELSRVMFERVADVKFLSTGNVLSNPNFTIPEKVDYLRDMERTYKTYASMSIYATNGTKIGDTRNVLVGINESAKPFFMNAIKGEIYYDRIPVMSQSLKQYVIHFSAPLYDAEGKISGVVVTRFPINKLHEVFNIPNQDRMERQEASENNNGNGMEIDLVSSNGLVLYSNYDRKSILNRNLSETSFFQELKQQGSEGGLTSISGQEPIFIGLGQGGGYLDYKGSDWFLILTENSQEIFAGLYALITQYIVISAVILIAAVLIIFVLAARISRPITQLRRAATEVSNGRYDIPIIVTGKNKRNNGNKSMDVGKSNQGSDEIGELASTLEVMRQNVYNVNSNLNALVVNRTKQLETANEVLKAKEIQLVDANKNLVMADRAKEEFMSMISHELKSPLAPMKLYTEMLLKDNSTTLPVDSPSSTDVGYIDRRKKGLLIILKNILRLEMLVSDILDVYKLDIGTLKLHKTIIEVTELVEENVTNLRPLAEDKKAHLIEDTRATLGVSLWCDPHRITQVISNLVRNSIDFVPEETGKIVIRTSICKIDIPEVKKGKENERRQMVLFEVEDNGTGIPKDKIDSLFRKFYQLDTTLTRSHGGTGLGLVICKGIIEAHGGEIWIDKEYTEGARVKFTVPLREGDNSNDKGQNDKRNRNPIGEH
jgi:signal transduction histidine kinase